MRAFGYLCVVFLASLALPVTAHATTIDYSTVGTFTGTSFSTGGLTATAENGGTLSISGSSAKALGVAGGASSFGYPMIDGSESVRFSFDSGAATDVSFVFNVISGGTMKLEAFGLNNASLGTVSFDPFDAYILVGALDVSGLFGDAGLSGFRIAANGSSATLLSVAFTDAVPEPASLLLLGTGLVGAVVSRRRTRA